MNAAIVPIPPIPDELSPAYTVYGYWWSDHPDAQFFRHNARKFNSHFCFGSATIVDRGMDGLQGGPPGQFAVRGEILHSQRPLLPRPGAAPRQCQLYLVDPDYDGPDVVVERPAPDVEQRLLHERATLYFRTNPGFIAAERERFVRIGAELFTALRACNPFLRDFQAVVEQPLDIRRNATFVICGDPQSVVRTPQRYVRPTGMTEVAMLRDSPYPSRSDVLLRRRNDGWNLEPISVDNRYYMLARFPMFFPEGVGGWYRGMFTRSGRVVTMQLYYKYLLQDHLVSTTTSCAATG
eukprot:GHVU01024895.1.p1 GENE.GHVU01024895.1~~GHVU01024895.1.p1  ORF type:complete len:312 (+),score=21.77 GHVU01024895.1:57-938(+)